MFKVLVHKKNNNILKKIIIPKNQGYNPNSWILITITGKKEFLMQRFYEKININEEEWEEKSNYGFPSALVTEFLRLDFDEDEITTHFPS